MKNKLFYSVIALIVLASAVFWGYMFQSTEAEQPESETPDYFDGSFELTMYHAEGCECCVEWAKYLENNGVDVTSELVEDLHEMKREKGVPGQLSSCHTAIADGYVIEGHVPIEDIRQLLAERPAVIGVSVPGMPPNSPGMDQPVENTYQSVIFDKENMYIYNTHN
ncbi:DUF411 domain-containing protein [Rhodohalobacter barkolensis]|uniref:CopG family transcriptional regulator n=1 Tax=Rhodohalobacter barkolensis TaxID=2053187 RepID=A0A2N0VE56_9BACT|nr:DUF411 domain-containing protein [Rhodohalobacter barkolensis]PKD42481.1 hypothetical protein CWD77_13775 [Rhodohalobacter barkolensis]